MERGRQAGGRYDMALITAPEHGVHYHPGQDSHRHITRGELGWGKITAGG